MRIFVRYLLCSTLNGFSQILLQSHKGCGLMILLAIGFHDQRLLCGSLLGVLAGTAAAWSCGYGRGDIDTWLYGYNAALLGLLITRLLGFSPPAILLIAALAALSSPVQHHLLKQMREHRGLPGFTLPFVLFGWLVMALYGLIEGTDLPSLPEHSLDGWGAISGMLRGVAQVMLLSDPLAGLCLFAALLVADRRAALWTLCGSAVGIFVALTAGGSDMQALEGLAGYNPALAALALSQVHRSPLAPAVGIALAITGGLVFEQLGIPPLTMPFILTCWTVALVKVLSQRPAHLLQTR